MNGLGPGRSPGVEWSDAGLISIGRKLASRPPLCLALGWHDTVNDASSCTS
jgi:hypothetical protein